MCRRETFGTFFLHKVKKSRKVFDFLTLLCFNGYMKMITLVRRYDGRNRYGTGKIYGPDAGGSAVGPATGGYEIPSGNNLCPCAPGFGQGAGGAVGDYL
jgi:hypothetical protein